MADEEMQPLMAAQGISLEQAYQQVCRDVPLRRPASAQECPRLPVPLLPAGVDYQRRDAGCRRRRQRDVPTLAFA
jgi:hypothetical protein